MVASNAAHKSCISSNKVTFSDTIRIISFPCSVAVYPAGSSVIGLTHSWTKPTVDKLLIYFAAVLPNRFRYFLISEKVTLLLITMKSNNANVSSLSRVLHISNLYKAFLSLIDSPFAVFFADLYKKWLIVVILYFSCFNFLGITTYTRYRTLWNCYLFQKTITSARQNQVRKVKDYTI